MKKLRWLLLFCFVFAAAIGTTAAPTEFFVEAGHPATERTFKASSPDSSLVAWQLAMQRCKAFTPGTTQHCAPRKVDGETVRSAQQLRDQAAKRSAKLSLFEVSSESGEAYLFGTVHALKPNLYPLDTAVSAAFTASNKLVLEVDMSARSAAEQQAIFLDNGYYPEGPGLNTHLSAGASMAAKTVAELRGYSLLALNRLRPWMFEQTLTVLELKRLGYLAEHGVDTYLDSEARAHGKAIIGLETIEQQISLLTSLSKEESERNLLIAMQAISEGTVQAEMDALVIDWLSGDVDAIYEKMMAIGKQYPELMRFLDLLIDKRNHRMASGIDTIISEGGVSFVAVGVGHLGGPQGLVQLLQQSGYTVRQLERVEKSSVSPH